MSGLLYTDELAEQVLDLISQGVSIRKISALQGFPCRRVIHNWVNGDSGAPEEFNTRYHEARDAMVHTFAEQIVDIADEMMFDPETGKERVPEKNEILANKLRTENRKWLVSRLKPDSYGDRLALDAQVKGETTIIVESGIGGAPGSEAVEEAEEEVDMTPDPEVLE